MKLLPLLLVALVLSAAPALAQTVLPSGAVAPSGTGGITPGTVPGSQPVTTPDMRNAGSPRAASHDEKVPGMSHHDEKKLRKMGKVKSRPDGSMKVPTN